MRPLSKRLYILLSLLVIIAAGAFIRNEIRGYQSESPLKVTTFNVGTLGAKEPELEKVSEIFNESGSPDILLLQEVPKQAWSESLADTLNYRFRVFTPYPSGNHGLAVLSSYPLRLLRSFDFNKYGAMAAEADINGEKILLVSVHLERIRGISIIKERVELSLREAMSLLRDEVTQNTDRTQAIAELMTWIKDQPYTHVIVAGDFNTIPFSKSIRTINRDLDDTLWPSLQYFYGSYKESPLPLSPRIDYIFHSPNLKCTDAGIVKESDGDHYPVWAEFERQ